MKFRGKKRNFVHNKITNTTGRVSIDREVLPQIVAKVNHSVRMAFVVTKSANLDVPQDSLEPRLHTQVEQFQAHQPDSWGSIIKIYCSFSTFSFDAVSKRPSSLSFSSGASVRRKQRRRKIILETQFFNFFPRIIARYLIIYIVWTYDATSQVLQTFHFQKSLKQCRKQLHRHIVYIYI